MPVNLFLICILLLFFNYNLAFYCFYCSFSHFLLNSAYYRFLFSISSIIYCCSARVQIGTATSTFLLLPSSFSDLNDDMEDMERFSLWTCFECVCSNLIHRKTFRYHQLGGSGDPPSSWKAIFDNPSIW